MDFYIVFNVVMAFILGYILHLMSEDVFGECSPTPTVIRKRKIVYYSNPPSESKYQYQRGGGSAISAPSLTTDLDSSTYDLSMHESYPVSCQSIDSVLEYVSE